MKRLTVYEAFQGKQPVFLYRFTNFQILKLFFYDLSL